MDGERGRADLAGAHPKIEKVPPRMGTETETAQGQVRPPNPFAASSMAAWQGASSVTPHMRARVPGPASSAASTSRTCRHANNRPRR